MSFFNRFVGIRGAAQSASPQTMPRYAADRVEWVDIAKGICIILVVMMHTTLGVEADMGQEGWMHLFVAFAAPFRMPDFFLLSGLFLAKAISRDWRGFADRRILHFAYFYLLWLVITCAVKCTLEGYSISESLTHMVTGLYEPFSTLWFIYMLAIFSVVIKLTARVPVPLMFAAAVGLRMAGIETGWLVIDQFAALFVFFYAGYAFADLAFGLARFSQRRWIQVVAIVVLWALANAALVASGWSQVAIISLVLGFAGCAAIVIVSSLIKDSSIGRALLYIGKHSIVIYLAFFIPMAAGRIILVKSGVPLDPGTISLIVLIGAVVAPLIGHLLIRKTPLNFVFERPAWARIDPPKHAQTRYVMTPAE